MPTTLYAVLSDQTGYAETISPSSLALVRDGSYGGPGSAIWIGKVSFHYSNGQGSIYYLDPFDIRVACAEEYVNGAPTGVYKWYNVDGGATMLVSGDGRSAASASCDPLELVFHDGHERWNPDDPLTGMSYTMTVTAGMSGMSVTNTEPHEDDTTEDGELRSVPDGWNLNGVKLRIQTIRKPCNCNGKGKPTISRKDHEALQKRLGKR